MTAIEKAPASAVTLTRASGSISPTETTFILQDSGGPGNTFTEKTACLIFETMCQLLGQQEGVKLTAKVSRKESKQAG